MFTKRETEVYLECDACGLLVFAGFADEHKSDITGALERVGWRFGEKDICPLCARKEAEA